jgi:hypothetical protein
MRRPRSSRQRWPRRSVQASKCCSIDPSRQRRRDPDRRRRYPGKQAEGPWVVCGRFSRADAMAGIGASRPLPSITTKVRLLNRLPTLDLAGRDYSSCPIPAVRSMEQKKDGASWRRSRVGLIFGANAGGGASLRIQSAKHRAAPGRPALVLTPAPRSKPPPVLRLRR